MSFQQQADLLVTTATFSCIPAILIGIFLVIWIFYYHLEHKSDQIGIWSILGITFFSLSCAAVALYLKTEQTDNQIPQIVFGHLSGFLYALGTVSIYTLFIKRLQFTFNQTKYAVPTHISITMYIGCILFIILEITGIMLWFSEYYHYITAKRYDDIIVILIAICQTLDLLLSIGLISLFVHRLRLLNIDAAFNHLYYQQTDENHAETFSVQRCSFSDGQRQIIKSMSKITVLSCIAIIVSQLLFMYEGIVFWLDVPPILDAVRFINWPINCIVNSVCVVLNFDVANGCYNRLCWGCDYCCLKICMYKARKKQNEFREILLSESLQTNNI